MRALFQNYIASSLSLICSTLSPTRRDGAGSIPGILNHRTIEGRLPLISMSACVFLLRNSNGIVSGWGC